MKQSLIFLFVFMFCLCSIYSQNLDKPVAADNIVRVEFMFEGWHNEFSGKDMMSLIQIIETAFGNNVQLNAALNYLMKTWPQGAEIMALGGVNNSNWNTTTARTNYIDTGTMDYYTYDATKISPANNYYLDEYGQLTSANQDVINNWNTSSSFTNVTTATYNADTYIAAGRVAGTPSYSLDPGTHGDQASHITNAVNIYINNKEYTLQDQVFCSPIVLNMNGDGKLQASNGQWLPHKYAGGKLAKFDMDGNGFPKLTEWVGPDDGLLIVYKNQETVTGHDLFGDADGFLNGYFKLQLLDANHDGKLTGDELKTLSVWQDKNGNAQIDPGEVKTLKELGITEINLQHKNLVSTFVQNGKTKTMWDWYPCAFAIKPKQ